MEEIKKLEIFYIRHADTYGAGPENRQSFDIGINKNGENQLRLLGERFRGKSFDAILCSPLIRCVRTACAVNNNLETPLPVEIIPELMEKGTPPDFRPDYVLLKSISENIIPCADKITDGFNTGSDRENDIRAEALIKYIKNRFGFGNKILVVSHGSFGNHFISEALGIKNPDFIFSISHTSVSKIKYTSDGKTRLSFSDDISHLRPMEEDCEFNI